MAEHSGMGERTRLAEAAAGTTAWYRWGPYLADRQWGTVREDYSANGDAWGYLPHDHARSRAYRWGEDGLLGISDDQARLCFAITLWNGRDPILKERLFGLPGRRAITARTSRRPTSTSTPRRRRAICTLSTSTRWRPSPMPQLVAENARRTKDEPEYELADTGASMTTATSMSTSSTPRPPPTTSRSASPSRTARRNPPRSTCCRRSGSATPGHGVSMTGGRRSRRPPGPGMRPALRPSTPSWARTWLTTTGPTVLMTENETNAERLLGVPVTHDRGQGRIPRRVIGGDRRRLQSGHPGRRPRSISTGRWHRPRRGPRPAPGAQRRAAARPDGVAAPARSWQAAARGGGRVLRWVTPSGLTDDERLVQRQAFAGLVWGKQSYHYDVGRWLDGDPAGPPPPHGRADGRNADWRELNNADVISMPDPWEYPWYAAWDLAFHCIPFALIDPAFAKAQLLLLTREWYMHPNGQLPAYEWSFSDVNPPVHAWATWRVYKIERRRSAEWAIARSSSGSSTSCCSTSRGGSTARTARATTSSRAGSLDSTTSASSIAAPRCPAEATSARPTARRGWASTRFR